MSNNSPNNEIIAEGDNIKSLASILYVIHEGYNDDINFVGVVYGPPNLNIEQISYEFYKEYDTGHQAIINSGLPQKDQQKYLEVVQQIQDQQLNKPYIVKDPHNPRFNLHPFVGWLVTYYNCVTVGYEEVNTLEGWEKFDSEQSHLAVQKYLEEHEKQNT